MQQRTALEIYFNLGGDGLVPSNTSTTYPAVTGVIDNLANRVDYDLTGYFATLELEIYDGVGTTFPSVTDTLIGRLEFSLTDNSYILKGALPNQPFSIQDSATTNGIQLTALGSNGQFVLQDAPPTYADAIPPMVLSSALSFDLFNDTTILDGALPNQPFGVQDSVITSSIQFTAVGSNGQFILQDGEPQYYSAAQIQGATASTPTFVIESLPILQGALRYNPAGFFPIVKSGNDSTEFQFNVFDSAGSTLNSISLLIYDQQKLTANLTASVSLVADGKTLNDGSGIFGTTTPAPQVYTYPDGSVYPQKQVWTI